MNLLNTDPALPVTISRGDRIAQLVVQQVARARFVVTDALPASDARDRRPRVHRGHRVVGDNEGRPVGRLPGRRARRSGRVIFGRKKKARSVEDEADPTTGEAATVRRGRRDGRLGRRRRRAGGPDRRRRGDHRRGGRGRAGRRAGRPDATPTRLDTAALDATEWRTDGPFEVSELSARRRRARRRPAAHRPRQHHRVPGARLGAAAAGQRGPGHRLGHARAARHGAGDERRAAGGHRQLRARAERVRRPAQRRAVGRAARRDLRGRHGGGWFRRDRGRAVRGRAAPAAAR